MSRANRRLMNSERWMPHLTLAAVFVAGGMRASPNGTPSGTT